MASSPVYSLQGKKGKDHVIKLIQFLFWEEQLYSAEQNRGNQPGFCIFALLYALKYLFYLRDVKTIINNGGDSTLL